jgi:hypothetical protein
MRINTSLVVNIVTTTPDAPDFSASGITELALDDVEPRYAVISAIISPIILLTVLFSQTEQ